MFIGLQASLDFLRSTIGSCELTSPLNEYAWCIDIDFKALDSIGNRKFKLIDIKFVLKDKENREHSMHVALQQRRDDFIIKKNDDSGPPCQRISLVFYSKMIDVQISGFINFLEIKEPKPKPTLSDDLKAASKGKSLYGRVRNFLQNIYNSSLQGQSYPEGQSQLLEVQEFLSSVYDEALLAEAEQIDSRREPNQTEALSENSVDEEELMRMLHLTDHDGFFSKDMLTLRLTPLKLSLQEGREIVKNPLYARYIGEEE